MSKNIEINYKDNAGYELLYPKTKTDVNYLSSTINTLYGFTGENSLDDALAQLFLGVGKYGYAIHVEYPDGSPAEGFTVTGIDHPDGSSAVVTDANGDAVGVSAEQSVSIGVTSPYIDIQDISDFSIQSTGILTNQTATLQFKTSEYEIIEKSQEVAFSPFVISYDLTAVGGGGGGMKWDGTSSPRGGNGGGGGYVSTLLNINNDSPINISIGAGGEAGKVGVDSQAGKGGTTTVLKRDTKETILTAVGGDGGYEGDIGGTGNGSGGRNYYRQDASVTNGGNSTDRIFNNDSLPLAGGGGGGGHATSSGGDGGSPYGSDGDKDIYGNVTYSTGPTGPGGGGGGVLSSNKSYSGDGNKGAVYIKVHY